MSVGGDTDVSGWRPVNMVNAAVDGEMFMLQWIEAF